MQDCNVVCCLGLSFSQPVSIQKPEKGGTKTRDLPAPAVFLYGHHGANLRRGERKPEFM